MSGGERNVTVSGGERNVTVSGGERNVTVTAGESAQVVVHSPAELPPDELAALLAVLSATAVPPAVRPRRRERWGDPAQLLRGTLRPGPGAWSSTPPQA